MFSFTVLSICFLNSSFWYQKMSTFLSLIYPVPHPMVLAFLYPVQTTFAYLQFTKIFSSVLYRNFIVVGLHLAVKLIFCGWNELEVEVHLTYMLIQLSQKYLLKETFLPTLYSPGTIVKSQLTCVGEFLKILICFIDLFVSIFLILSRIF